jgi:hypothetical protein
MTNFDHHHMRVTYKGLEGLSEIGFKERRTLLADLFPTADEVVLSMAGCFLKVDESAAVIYEVPDQRFGIATTDGVLDMAVADPKGDYTGLIIDILAKNHENVEAMRKDIETASGFIAARLRDAMGIMEIPQDDYMQRLRNSLRLLNSELCK